MMLAVLQTTAKRAYTLSFRHRSAMHSEQLFRRYQDLQRYVGWTARDADLILAVRPLLLPHLPRIIEDFYAELQQHSDAAAVITGGAEQVERLKRTLLNWLEELLSGRYDEQYVVRRWLVGRRHVEIGLDQVYTNAAMSRLRVGLLQALETHSAEVDLAATRWALIRLSDLDLAIIEDAYQAEYVEHVQQSERLASSAEKHQLTRARDQSETAFRLLVETAECLVVIVREDGETVFLNRFAEAICGSHPVILSGQVSLTELLSTSVSQPEDRGLELPLVAVDGRERWILWHACGLPDYRGAPAILMVGLDVTERRKAQERVLQSERLAAIGQMVTGLAHESRNALQRSQANLEMLLLEVEDRPEAIRLIQRIQKAQDHLHHLYEEVRGYAAPITLRREECDLVEIVQSNWSHLEMFRKHKAVALQMGIKTVNTVCLADRHALEQVFRNILENSITACPEPGEIRVVIEDADLESRPAVRVTVHDNGPGLSPEQAARIFEPFFTTKTEGTGLGMAIARRIVDAHAGQIRVGSPQPGAELIVTLPRQ